MFPQATSTTQSNLPYQTPHLSMLGEVRSLTATGSVNGNEDNNPGNPGCQSITNPQNNMC